MTCADGGPSRRRAPVPLLFLVADTGGGHRAAARAVGEALADAYPDRFVPVLCDPLGGPGAARLLRWITGRYGPAIRLAPWLWGAAYHATNSGRVMRFLRRTLLTLADRPVASAVAAHRPAGIVSFHPLTGPAAVRARDGQAPGTPVVTVVTDLVTAHAAWRQGPAEAIVGPSGLASRMGIGLPVTSGYWAGPLPPAGRAALRQALGLAEQRFLIVIAGGGEGCGGIGRRTAAILRRFDDVHVVAVCGRNRRVQRRLGRLAAQAGGRLTVHGFVATMAELLHCADVVVTKAGPGTIAEAASCGAPLLLTSHLPGQERGNAELVVSAGAGRPARGVGRLIREIGLLRRDPVALDAMRAASGRLGRPRAATGIAALLAALVDHDAGDARPAMAGDGHAHG